MKILFLDIDGVLNDRSFRDINGYIMDPDRVLRLLDIIRQTDCYIVVSSNWRMSPLEEITKALSCEGAITDAEVKEITDKIYSRTPDLISSGNGTRTDEITSWIQSAIDDGHEIESWLSIDDLSLDLPSSNFIQTDDAIGLTDTHVSEAVDKLTSSDVEAVVA